MQVTRDAWLTRFAEMLRPHFKEKGYRIHGKIRVGMAPLPPSKLGLCFQRASSEDETNEIFLTTHLSDLTTIGEVLTHELIHAVLPESVKHGKKFAEACEAIGLRPSAELRYRATHPSPEYGTYLRQLADDLTTMIGPLPAPMKKRVRRKATRGGLLKAFCSGCKTVIRLTPTAMNRGMPLCGNDECEERGEPFILSPVD